MNTQLVPHGERHLEECFLSIYLQQIGMWYLKLILSVVLEENLHIVIHKIDN